MQILVLNGPNLNLLGKREPSVYGAKSFEDFYVELGEKFPAIQLNYLQSNLEGDLVTSIQNLANKFDGIVLNAGGYTHTSVAIRDAISATNIPVIEVHISNVTNRESFRHQSYITPVCAGLIMGFGLESYTLGVQALCQLIQNKQQ
ncbi:type II 3-dehydroquinate dehydratase [Putridiphycobacter roseus]|uniref:3-dehydroquinate dehydratase n=1 Tax=Putridiphycobacter roseus TaxID=2219161 RepID=A0A2W1MZR2_9FLAO|nr:type II 3-dehydroquinate dehydratase [Putridiphycobacter roseus]PZE16111.1 type II 3-dehydroquinate dehydratase [Putridiphycobacter roseus]